MNFVYIQKIYRKQCGITHLLGLPMAVIFNGNLRYRNRVMSKYNLIWTISLSIYISTLISLYIYIHSPLSLSLSLSLSLFLTLFISVSPLYIHLSLKWEVIRGGKALVARGNKQIFSVSLNVVVEALSSTQAHSLKHKRWAVSKE